MTARGVIIAAPRSGAGKTTVTLGLLAALKRRGVAVRAAKAGPDYIDPAFHAAATGVRGFNLDTWAMPPSLLDWLLAETARHCELLVIEGVMGLFDGVPGPRGCTGAAADLAARFGFPVLLVLDVSAQAQSAAAVVRGFCSHDPDSPYRRRRAQPHRERAPSPAGGRCDLGARRTCHGRAAARRHHLPARAAPRPCPGRRA